MIVPTVWVNNKGGNDISVALIFIKMKERERENANFPGYSFLIRDDSGCLQAKCEVNGYNAMVQHVNGSVLFKITGKDTANVNE